jgi:quercetin dioxygenase-like cupin family protein
VTVAAALARLAATPGAEFQTVFTHGTLAVEVYRPAGVDRQTPHTRDEAYVVISGTGTFEHAGRCEAVGPGTFLFVAAGEAHRFVDFTADFDTWVLFYGPEGGEMGKEARPADAATPPDPATAGA